VLTLTDRTQQILDLIVRDYIETASPVGSRTLSKNPQLNVSPATIRNEMGTLEDAGYILRPHSSAGGVPSDKGYRFFVEALPSTDNPPGEARETLEIEIAAVRQKVEEWAKTASATLSELIGALAFVSPPRTQTFRVKQIELVRIQESAALLVVILHGAAVHKLMVQLEAPTPAEQLERTRNRVASVVADKTAREIVSTAPRTADKLESDVIGGTVGLLRSEEAKSVPEFEFHGLSELFSQPEFSDGALGRDLVDLLDDKAPISDLAASAPDDGTVGVFIGAEMDHGPLSEFSVIVCRYGAMGETLGTVGIVGPKRLRYEFAMPVVHHTANLMSDLSEPVAFA